MVLQLCCALLSFIICLYNSVHLLSPTGEVSVIKKYIIKHISAYIYIMMCYKPVKAFIYWLWMLNGGLEG